MNKKHRISIAKNISSGIRSSSPVDFDSFDNFIGYLQDNGISSVSFRYYDMFHEEPNWRLGVDNKLTEELVEEDFIWLSTKNNHEHRYLEIITQKNAQYITEKNMLHPKLMPFTKDQLLKYFQNDKHFEYFTKSIDNYKTYQYNKSNTPNSEFKKLRQAEKDERFFTTRYFVALFERHKEDLESKLRSILKLAYGNNPPLDIIGNSETSWNALIDGNLELILEHVVSAPKEYKSYLSKNLDKRHFVQYVLDSGTQKKDDSVFRIDLEGATHLDAFIQNKSNDFKLYIEAKYLSDISYDVSYDVTRNQLARNIDIMLEDQNSKSFFLLITPTFFKDNPHTRLYGYKMADYMSNHLNLMADLSHRTNIEPYEWKNIQKRIAWITWEDLDRLGLII